MQTYEITYGKYDKQARQYLAVAALRGDVFWVSYFTAYLDGDTALLIKLDRMARERGEEAEQELREIAAGVTNDNKCLTRA